MSYNFKIVTMSYWSILVHWSIWRGFTHLSLLLIPSQHQFPFLLLRKPYFFLFLNPICSVYVCVPLRPELIGILHPPLSSDWAKHKKILQLGPMRVRFRLLLQRWEDCNILLSPTSHQLLTAIQTCQTFSYLCAFADAIPLLEWMKKSISSSICYFGLNPQTLCYHI